MQPARARIAHVHPSLLNQQRHIPEHPQLIPVQYPSYRLQLREAVACLYLRPLSIMWEEPGVAQHTTPQSPHPWSEVRVLAGRSDPFPAMLVCWIR